MSRGATLEAPTGVECHRSAFAEVERELASTGPEAFHAVRRQALERFLDSGYPTTDQEDWIYTNVAPLTGMRFRLARRTGREAALADALRPALFGALEGNRIVCVDGHHAPELSSVHYLPPGVRVGSLRAALRGEPSAIEPLLTRLADPEAHPFVALNTAFLEDGIWVHVPRGVAIAEPLQIVHVSTGAAGGPQVSHPRTLVVAEAGSQAILTSSYLGLGAGVRLTNAVCEVAVGENAGVELVTIQNEGAQTWHFETLQVRQARSSRFSSRLISLGALLSRSEVNLVLDGEGCESALDGLYRGSGDQHLDMRTVVDNRQPHCSSRELYKGILDGRARAVFNGKIFVRAGAQKTDAKQSNKNLLLSPDATVNTKPQLEIFADDVKCTHGATIGQLEDEALFYLRTRGLGEAEARRMLTSAFAGEIVSRIHCGVVRGQLERALFRREGGGTRP